MLMLPRGRKVGPAIFDRRNQELTHGLISYYSPVLTGPTGLQLLDLSGQDNHGTLTNMDPPTDWVDSQYGKVLDFDGTNDNAPLRADAALYTMPFSVSAWALARTVTQNFTVFSAGSSTNAIPIFNVGFRGDSTGDPIQIQMRGSNNVNSVCNGAGFVANRFYHVVGVFASGTSRTVYVDGVQGQTDTTSHTATALDRVTIGALIRNTSVSFLNGQVAEVGIWNREINASEIQSLYALEPGGLGRRLRDNFFFYETAIGYLLEASTASYALTGQPIPLLYGRSLPADTGSVLLSGQTTPLVTSRLLNADQGSYAYTGTDAATLLGRLLDAGAAVYTLDGNAAGFIASRRISVDTVAYLASGLDVGFLRSRVLEAGTGQYVLVASPVNLQTGTPGTGGAAPYYYLFLLGGSR